MKKPHEEAAFFIMIIGIVALVCGCFGVTALLIDNLDMCDMGRITINARVVPYVPKRANERDM